MKNQPLKKFVLGLLVLLAALGLFCSVSFAHCQIPCGIYDDHARVRMMLEDSATILKAVKMIESLSGKTDNQSHNQRVRWIMNKETHAQNIIAAISDYFLTQRVKTAQKDYLERLARHHAVIVAAMKAKQSAGEGEALALEKAIREMEPYYQKK